MLWGNYLITLKRNLLKHKGYSAINILGLALGIVSCVLIVQYVSYHLSFDQFHKNYDRIYRVTNDRLQEGKLVQHGTITYPTIGPAMEKDYPEVELYTRMIPWGDMLAKANDQWHKGGSLVFADQNFFTVFSFNVIDGDVKSLLSKPYQIALSQKRAAILFETDVNSVSSVIGKSVKLANLGDFSPAAKQEYEVVAIFENVPGNSHIQFEALASFSSLYDAENSTANDSWRWSDFYHYLLLKPGVDARKLESKFPEFSTRYFQGSKVSGSEEEFFLQPLSKVHLYSDYEYDFAQTKNGKAIWMLALIASIILVLAWINYVNLTTARSVDRTKEVGVRKTMGASSNQITMQFLIEAFTYCLISLLVAFILISLIQPYFNQLILLDLDTLSALSTIQTEFIAGFILLLAAGIITSGVAASVFIKATVPGGALKSTSRTSPAGQSFRSALVIIQFAVSSALIIGTLVVGKQLYFMNNSDLGISLDNKIIISGPQNTTFDSTFIQRVDNFKETLKRLSFVDAAATSNRWPGRRLGRNFNIRLTTEPETAGRTMSWAGVDYNYFATYSIKIIAGRSFIATDHDRSFQELKSVIINTKASVEFGFSNPEDAIGRELYCFNKKWTIVGVVNTFHQESLHHPLESTLFFPFYGTGNSITVQLIEGNYQNYLDQIRKLYDEFFPGNLFEYSVLKESFNNSYSDDRKFSYVILLFTGIAIFISILGLLGLASYLASRRIKELSIRKVLGASTWNLINVLSKGFLMPVLVAVLIAIPLTYYFMSDWLTNFAYKIELNWQIFLAPLTLVLLVAIVTALSQLIKATKANPAETLKAE